MRSTIFRQFDDRWGKLPFPKGDTVAGSGCGLCSVTHILIETDKYKDYDPRDVRPYMIKWAVKNEGLIHQGIPDSLKHYGMKNVKEFGRSATMKQIFAEMGKGGRKGVILFVKVDRHGNLIPSVGPDGTYWTGGGHFVAVLDYKVDKKGRHWFYCKDSGPRKHDKWFCYETSMKGCVWKMWTCTLPKATPKQKTYKMIDVSDWQGKIDWKKVKADGVSGAIIRYADGDVLDKRFEENMKGAKAAGLHFGSYIFSRAKTKAGAEKEAARLYKAARKYGPDMPLYIDLEAKGLEKYADTIADAFIKKMKALGGKPGVYANLNWWNNYLKTTASKHTAEAFWIAQYNDTMDYRPASRMGMWQYSSSGKVNGISGRVDMDKCYREYWKSTPKPTTPKKPVDEIAKEPSWFEKANAWATKIAADNSYHYMRWTSDKKTHECPICHDHPEGPYRGWNCIGFAFACWHHGGSIPCKCNCHVVSNEAAEQIAGAKTDAEALAIAQDRIGIKDIEVIRNNGKNVPKSQWKPGDIGFKFSGETYKHTFYVMGDGKIADSSGRGGDGSSDIAISSDEKYTARVIIRYTGK